jgi:hypothetical protein
MVTVQAVLDLDLDLDTDAGRGLPVAHQGHGGDP